MRHSALSQEDMTQWSAVFKADIKKYVLETCNDAYRTANKKHSNQNKTLAPQEILLETLNSKKSMDALIQKLMTKISPDTSHLFNARPSIRDALQDISNKVEKSPGTPPKIPENIQKLTNKARHTLITEPNNTHCISHIAQTYLQQYLKDGTIKQWMKDDLSSDVSTICNLMPRGNSSETSAPLSSAMSIQALFMLAETKSKPCLIHDAELFINQCTQIWLSAFKNPTSPVTICTKRIVVQLGNEMYQNYIPHQTPPNAARNQIASLIPAGLPVNHPDSPAQQSTGAAAVRAMALDNQTSHHLSSFQTPTRQPKSETPKTPDLKTPARDLLNALGITAPLEKENIRPKGQETPKKSIAPLDSTQSAIALASPCAKPMSLASSQNAAAPTSPRVPRAFRQSIGNKLLAQ